MKDNSLPDKKTPLNKNDQTLNETNKKNAPNSNQPISFAVMIHLEGDLNIENEKSYENINSDIKEILDLFSKYDAVATVESELSYANAASK